MSDDSGILRMPRPQVNRRNVLLHLFGAPSGRSPSPSKEAALAKAQEEERLRKERLSRLAIPLSDTAIVFFKDMCVEHRQTFVVFPLDGDDFKEFVLGPAEEEHIAMAREVIPELRECEKLACSGKLSGKALTKTEFWFVYFTLLKPFEVQQKRPDQKQKQQIDLPHISVPQSLSMVPVNRLDGFLATPLNNPYPRGSAAHLAFLFKALRKSLAARGFMEHRLELNEKIKEDIIRQCPRGTRQKTWTYLLGCAPFTLHDPGCFDNAVKELNARKARSRSPALSSSASTASSPLATSVTTAAAVSSTSASAAADGEKESGDSKSEETSKAEEAKKSVETAPLFGAQMLFNKSDYENLVGLREGESLDWSKWRIVLELLAMDWGSRAPLLFVPDLVALLIYVLHDENLAYVGASLLLADSGLNSTIFPMSHASESAWMDLFESLVGTNVPRLSEHMKLLWLDVCSFASTWLERLFVGSAPMPTVLRFCDCLLCDGSMAFFRIAISLLQRFEEDLLKTTSAEEFTETLAQLMHELNEPDEIIAIAYTIPLNPQLFPPNGNEHTHVVQVTDTVTEANKLADDNNMQKPYIRCNSPSVLFQSPRQAGFGLTPTPDGIEEESIGANPSGIMSRTQFVQLSRWLPPYYSIMEPLALFTTAKDGFSLDNMMRHVEGHSPLILVVETTDHNVFGSFVPGQLYSKGEHFYGTGEAFLFTFAPKPIIYEWRKGRNQFFFMVNNKTIAIGGGGQGPGLYIDGELNNGQSHRCATFCNAPLNNGKTDFVVLALEVFTFKSDD